MKKHNKFTLLLLFIVLFLVTGCTVSVPPEPNEEEVEKEVSKAFAALDEEKLIIEKTKPTLSNINQLTILTVNDFHGALEEADGEKGMARVGGYITERYNEKPDETLIISAGDMFQGTAVSNYRQGRDVIKTMNAIGFDAMVIGNHEFDWSLTKILEYVDGNETNGEANFPFLGCNIAQKSKNGELPTFLKPYTIVEKGNLKIGIIGFIGYGLESDIATNQISDYEFLRPVPLIEKYAKELREEKGCDVIIAAGHDDNDSTNTEIAFLTGSAKVDAIINGHNHLNKASYINCPDERLLPYVQAGSSGAYVGEISFGIDNKDIISMDVHTNRMSSYVQKNEILDNYVNRVVEITAPIFKRVLVTAGQEINKYACIDWAVDALRKATSVDIAFINDGGIRATAFPINDGQKVTVSKVYEIMPFDNTVKTVLLKGEDILLLCELNGISVSTNVFIFGNNITIDGEKLVLDRYYTVAAVDYIFDKPEYPFVKGENINATGILFRDILIEGLEEIHSNNKKWTI